MKKLLVLCAALTLASCSSTINFISIDAEGSAKITADLSIPTSQDSGDGAADALGLLKNLIPSVPSLPSLPPEVEEDIPAPPLVNEVD